MRIAMGSDHAGFELKEHLKGYLQGKGHDAVSYTHLDVYKRQVEWSMLNATVTTRRPAGWAGFGYSVSAFPRRHALLRLRSRRFTFGPTCVVGAGPASMAPARLPGAPTGRCLLYTSRCV